MPFNESHTGGPFESHFLENVYVFAGVVDNPYERTNDFDDQAVHTDQSFDEVAEHFRGFSGFILRGVNIAIAVTRIVTGSQ